MGINTALLEIVDLYNNVIFKGKQKKTISGHY